MPTPAETLWQINQEFSQRLAKARHLADLAAGLLSGSTPLDTAILDNRIAYVREALYALHEAHREWRYSYLYESPDTKRIVQDERAVFRALSQFQRGRGRRQAALDGLRQTLADVPRPQASRLPAAAAEVWTRLLTAVNDLYDFEDTVHPA